MAEKKTISAREVIADIREGMTDDQLMRKHSLSAKGLSSLKNKLLNVGLITQAELSGQAAPNQTPTQAVDKEALARHITEAVKSGLPDDEIVKRFGIPAGKLPDVFASLIKGGYLTQEDLDRRPGKFEQTVHLGTEAPFKGQTSSPTGQESTRDVLRDFAQRFNVPREDLERLRSASVKDIKAFFDKHEIPWSEGVDLAKALGLSAKDLVSDAADKFKGKAKGLLSRFGKGGNGRSAGSSPPPSTESIKTLTDPPTESPLRKPRAVTKCPNCRMPQDRPFEVCPQCGVLVEKFLQRLERKPEGSRSKSKSKLKTVVIAAGIILVLGAITACLVSLFGGKKAVSTVQTAKSESEQVAASEVRPNDETDVSSLDSVSSNLPQQSSPQNIMPSNDRTVQASDESREAEVPGLMNPAILYLEFERNEVMANAKYKGKRLNCSLFESASAKENPDGSITVLLPLDRYATKGVIYLINEKHKKLIVEKGLPASVNCYCLKLDGNVLVLGDCNPIEFHKDLEEARRAKDTSYNCVRRCREKYNERSRRSRCIEECARVSHKDDR